MPSPSTSFPRSAVAGLLLGLAGLLAAPVVFPAGPDLSTAEGQLDAMRRIQCSRIDGKPATYYWKGVMYSRVPGEPDRLLFNVEGMNIRQCGPLANAANKADFRMVSREILLYEDPATGEVLRTWTNPWTGKTVKVIHTANDPVNFNLTATSRDGKPRRDITTMGNHWWISLAIPLYFPDPLGGDYQKYVGGMSHETELFNFFGSVDELRNAKLDSVNVAVGWERLSNWLPWMEMGDRAGMIYFQTAGRKLDQWDDLSPTMKAEIGKNYPAWRNPPPLDDRRPSESSWTYFKKMIKPGPAAPAR